MQPTISKILTRGIAIVALGLLLLANAAPAQAQTVQVLATAGWVDTAIHVEAGQVLTITASGTAITQAGNPAASSGPNGQAVPCPDPNYPPVAGIPCLLNGIPYGTLVGRIGDGAPFKVGANYRAVVSAAGTLFLGVNDHFTPESLADNQGQFQAQVTVAGAETAWCVSADPNALIGCAEISLSPAGLTGDFSLGETHLAQAQNPGRVVLPPGSQRVNITNIVSTEAGFGTLFIYNDSQAYLYTRANEIARTTVYPTKKFIRGTLNLKCDIRNTIETDSLGCQVSIDGTAQADVLIPGAQHSYILDPGAHTVLVTLVGESIPYWTPASQDLKATIYAGRTTSLSPRFDKMAHLLISNNQPGVLADYYVDGALVAQQVAATDLWVAPNRSHRVEAKNFTDPTANGVWTFANASTYVYPSPGQEVTVALRLVKTYIQGFLAITCEVTPFAPGDPAHCLARVDGTALPPITPGTIGTFPLAVGSHDLVVIAGPEGQVASQPQTSRIQIYAGQTVRRTTRFELVQPAHGGTPGMLVVIANQPDWVDSGIAVRAGQSFTIEASGQMNPCLDTYPASGAPYCIFYPPVGSAGTVPYENEYGIFPGPGLRFMGLLGRIADGVPFYIGGGGTFTAAQTGTLWFTPNDNTRWDNQGAYNVLVWLQP